ncbi:MAG: AAA family ATPase [Planctomycetota bacterium]|nr:AAA family ATPase [Planctomycetota bacterium]
MLHLADLLASIPLPEPTAQAVPVRAGCGRSDAAVVHELGGDLPAGHLHVWGGPPGAGKTSFLLCLLQDAAVRGRRVVYATYELAPERLALRVLASTAGVDARALPDPGGDPATCTLDDAELARVHAVRDRLTALPFDILPARGFTAHSLRDRLVRMPFRAEVLAVDYLQAVVRAPNEDMGAALRELSDMAAYLHVAVVCAVRAPDTEGGGVDAPTEGGHAASASGASALELSVLEMSALDGAALDGAALDGAALDEICTTVRADRIGWIAPSEGAAGAREACVRSNRHGAATTVPLHLDGATGALGSRG